MTTTPVLHPRLALLRSLVDQQGGEWTRARVADAYANEGYDAPKHHTHKRDLDALHRAGVLDRHDAAGRRYYTPRGTA